jgi:hypothetical protein
LQDIFEVRHDWPEQEFPRGGEFDLGGIVARVQLATDDRAAKGRDQVMTVVQHLFSIARDDPDVNNESRFLQDFAFHRFAEPFAGFDAAAGK